MRLEACPIDHRCTPHRLPERTVEVAADLLA